MWPWSGLINPRHNFRMVLLPEPATPNRVLVSPRFSSNETPSSTVKPSKVMPTSSKMMALWTVPVGWFAKEDMESIQNKQERLGDEEVHSDDEHGGYHDSLGGRTAYSLSSSTGAQSEVAAHSRDDKTEQHWLEEPHENVIKNQRLVSLVPVLGRIQPDPGERNEPSADQAHQVGDHRKEEHHDHGGNHPRRHQLLIGIGAQSPHGVNLLGHLHGSQFAGHPGSIPAGNHQAGQHRAQLFYHRKRNQLSGQRQRPKLLQRGPGVEREHRPGKTAG